MTFVSCVTVLELKDFLSEHCLSIRELNCLRVQKTAPIYHTLYSPCNQELNYSYFQETLLEIIDLYSIRSENQIHNNSLLKYSQKG